MYYNPEFIFNYHDQIYTTLLLFYIFNDDFLNQNIDRPDQDPQLQWMPILVRNLAMTSKNQEFSFPL